ncbi:MAG TPA: BON domain-containing protein [Armatimonadetes bacterium]|jgi:hyperosmotically inducible protein|nr:BON domain-containing protein [Armatimonadota bacterium]
MISDTTIARSAKSALANDPRVGAMDITVHSYRGRVQLVGEVTSLEQMEAAEEVARSVPGVVEVINNLRLVRLTSRHEVMEES